MTTPVQVMLMPQYITLADITSRIGDKVIISDDDTGNNAIPTALANEMIAFAEADTETDLQIRFLTPFATSTGDWTTASTTTIAFLKKLFVARSIAYILRNFFGRSGNGVGNVMGGDFYEAAEIEYDILLKRVLKKLPNGLYAYQMMPDLLTNPYGINTVPTGGSGVVTYGCGDVSIADYAEHHILNPQSNFSDGFNIWV